MRSSATPPSIPRRAPLSIIPPLLIQSRLPKSPAAGHKYHAIELCFSAGAGVMDILQHEDHLCDMRSNVICNATLHKHGIWRSLQGYLQDSAYGVGLLLGRYPVTTNTETAITDYCKVIFYELPDAYPYPCPL